MEPVDLVGLPQVEDGRTVFRSPSFLPATGKGLLVFEELNRAPQQVRTPCLELCTRLLNDYQLPPGWLIVAAVNPAGGDYDVDEMDPALQSRFVRIGLEADRDGWLEWARAHDVHADVLDVKVLFGKRVRQLRKARGVSQEAFAHQIGIDRSYFGSIERGERNVSLDNICLIAKGAGRSARATDHVRRTSCPGNTRRRGRSAGYEESIGGHRCQRRAFIDSVQPREIRFAELQGI